MSDPDVPAPRGAEPATPVLPEEILRVEHVSITHTSIRGAQVVGCADVTLAVPTDASVGLVGESGHGKSTILSVISGARNPDTGTATVHGAPFRIDNAAWRRDFYRTVQFVSQNPYAAFNPRLSVLGQVASPARHLRGLSKQEATEQAYEMLTTVGLAREVGALRPAALSGGMLQRAAIARALICEPQCLILDEPTASLSPEGTREVVVVLEKLREQGRCSILITSHDLDVMSALCDQVHVVYRGSIVDSGPLEQLQRTASDEYTRRLVSAWQAHAAE